MCKDKTKDRTDETAGGSPHLITVTQDELRRIAGTLSRHGGANLAAKTIGWLDKANATAHLEAGRENETLTRERDDE